MGRLRLVRRYEKICASTLCEWEVLECVGDKYLEMNDLQVPITLKEGGGRMVGGISESYQKVVSCW